MSAPPTKAQSTLPPGYTLAHRVIMGEKHALIWLNVIGTLIFMGMLALTATGLVFYHQLGAPLVINRIPAEWPFLVYLAIIVSTLILHEALHGLAMILSDTRPRFGIKPKKLVLFTTTDAYFPRNRYLITALAPLTMISLLGIVLMLHLPQTPAIWIGMALAMNVASSIGDIWMTAIIVTYPADALFHDNEDGMTIYLPANTSHLSDET